MPLVDHPVNALTELTIGAAIEVHRTLGPGLLESSYQSCLCWELELRGIFYREHLEVPFEYKGKKIDRSYVLDLLVEEVLIVELKSVESLHSVHRAQLLTYMRLQGAPAGLLINFNVSRLVTGIKRVLI